VRRTLREYDRGDDILFAGRARRGRNAVDEDVGHGRVLGDRLLDEARIDEVAVVADAPTISHGGRILQGIANTKTKRPDEHGNYQEHDDDTLVVTSSSGRREYR
jgi:hypothetical protein